MRALTERLSGEIHTQPARPERVELHCSEVRVGAVGGGRVVAQGPQDPDLQRRVREVLGEALVGEHLLEEGRCADHVGHPVPGDVGGPRGPHGIVALSDGAAQPPLAVPTLGGSGPGYLFTEVLGAPVVTLPLANYDNNQHAANENLRLGNLWDGIEMYAGLLARLGREWGARVVPD